jgi:hypothetical protein
MEMLRRRACCDDATNSSKALDVVVDLTLWSDTSVVRRRDQTCSTAFNAARQSASFSKPTRSPVALL